MSRNKHYRIIRGCDHCEGRPPEVMDDEKRASWSCPYEDVSCRGEPEAVYWLQRNLQGILFGAGILAFLVLVLWLITPSLKSRMQERLGEMHLEATQLKKDVSRLPQNPGSTPPEESLWRTRIVSRGASLEKIPRLEDFRNLAALQELQGQMKREGQRAAVLSLPEGKPLPPLQKYFESANEVDQLERELSRLTREAREERVRGLDGRMHQISDSLQKTRKVLAEKSKVPSEENKVPLADLLTDYCGAVADADARIRKAIAAESARQEELKRLQEEEERKRQIEEQRRTEEEKRTRWRDAAPDFSIVAESCLLSPLLEPLVKSWLAGEKDSSNLQVLRKEGVTRLRSPKGKVALSASRSILSQGSEKKILTISVQGVGGDSSRIGEIIALDALVLEAGNIKGDQAVDYQKVDALLSGENTSLTLVDGQTYSGIKIPLPGSLGEHVIPVFGNPASQGGSGALKLTSFSASDRASMLGISQGGLVVYPGLVEISTESYRFTTRIYLEGVGEATEGSPDKAFQDYCLSAAGQAVIAGLGFVSLDVRNGQPVEDLPEYVLRGVPPGGVVVSGQQLSTVFRFNTDNASLDRRALADLTRVASSLARSGRGKHVAVLAGFADSSGESPYNNQLSKSRAETVGKHLLKEGTRLPLIKLVWCGERHPVAENTTDLGKALNRRVEVWLVKLK